MLKAMGRCVNYYFYKAKDVHRFLERFLPFSSHINDNIVMLVVVMVITFSGGCIFLKVT